MGCPSQPQGLTVARKLTVAAALANLYNSPGWVALQKQITASNALIEACKVAKECRLVVGSDGNLVMVQ